MKRKISLNADGYEERHHGCEIPAIIGAAMIKVLLTLLPMIGVLSTNGQTYQLLVLLNGAFSSG